MPPPDEKQPGEKEREAMLGYLDSKLLEHTRIGGTLPRRLNQAEYEATIQKLLHLPDFKLPQGFPSDTEYHGFNNVGEGLVLSPPHLEAYAKVARDIADEIFPPPKTAPKQKAWKAGPGDMVLSFSAAGVHGDALRLASRSVDIMRSCSWPSRIEISDSGTEATIAGPRAGAARAPRSRPAAARRGHGRSWTGSQPAFPAGCGKRCFRAAVPSGPVS